ncbi:MAG TPA: glycerol-3-phosphate dehydrogenase [Rhodocyclaceae bacterium]|nr:MAG: glycerol-3-phosphate dehydrogenase [Betaproteobacteria bacterium CG2_30_68_42]PIX76300.1 MAG: glycerol-3-phosphate dehydrogenase [Rhodocyclales bacterium CG_4_10_14_3_um_filter_68_10]PJA58633.1 MAG: glycerol-3-phosphate dehydrogenase [Rhodocyclales bacterium CG_4_9_14_3_um_filter_68_10]HCX33350.1 glycerol-3-phosphate dehydrogenase [Rhodocyclaceae bacterium]
MAAIDTNCDLLVIGGGINGAGIARDAAGRGLRTVLVEQGDFGGATSSASTKLIHGGLRYLEYFAYRLVAESLAEREVLLRIAPHIVSPLTFVMPHVSTLRPAWMIRAGLWLYDHIGGGRSLPGSRGVALRAGGYGAGLKPELSRGFLYSDARVDDARLVILNLRSAVEHGASVMPRTRLVRAVREQGRWRATLEAVRDGRRFELGARVLVNAAGPWVRKVIESTGGPIEKAGLRLVKGSHIVVPRIHPGEHAYLLQNTDRRVVFMIPWQEAYTLIGTTDVTVRTIAEAQAIDEEETRYLLDAVNRYLLRPLSGRDVVWSYTGVRPLYDDGKSDPAAVTRDYTLVTDERDGAVQLAVFGGKLTTYRRLAETVLDRLSPWLADRRGPWTHDEALPGGAFDSAAREATSQRLCARYPGLPDALVRRLFGRYGLSVTDVLADARSLDDLGTDFGGGLYRREAEHAIAHEWAMTADDILWRRTKCGLGMSPAQRERFAAWFDGTLEAAA